MKTNPNSLFARRSILQGTGSAILLAFSLLTPAAFAANQYFSDAGGPLSWDATTTSNWGATTTGPYNALWASGNTAVFEGTAGTVNVSGSDIPTFGGITFNITGYTLSGGTLNFGNSAVVINNSNAASISWTINSVIAGGGAAATLNFDGVKGGSSMTLGGANTYSATTTFIKRLSGGLSFNSLANAAAASSSFGTGSGTINLGGASSATSATYTGGTAATDRLWVLDGTGATTINNNGSGDISFNNTGNLATGATTARTLTLAGSYTATANTFAETVNDLGTSPNVTTLKVGGNTWNITGNNTHSGGTTLNSAGVINIGHANALGSGPFTVSANGSFDNTTGSDLTVANAFTLSGGSPTYVGSANNMSIDGAVTLSGTNRSITVSKNTLTLNGIIGEDTPARSLTKSGSGTLILSNASNSFTGGVAIASGVIGISSDGALGAAGKAVNFTGNANLIATGDATLAAARTVTVDSTKTGQFGITSGVATTFTVDAKITGSGNVSRLSGSAFTTGRVRFTNDTNDYTGVFDTRAAYTEFTSITNPGLPSALGAGTQINSVNGASFTVLSYVGTGNSSTTRPIVWSGTTGGLYLASNGTGTISYLNTTPIETASTGKLLYLIGTNTGDNVFAQPINNPPKDGISLQKQDAGKWILTAVNPYLGDTVITGGTLALGAAASINNSSTVDIAAGATLDISAKAAAFAIPATQTLSGAGSVTGQSLNIAGTVAPGTDVTGTLSTAAVSLQAASMMEVRVDSSAATADSLAVTGNLDINATATLNVSDLAAIPTAIGAKLTIATYTGTLTGTFAGKPEGSTVTVGPNNFKIAYHDGNAITLTSGSAYSTWIDTFPSLTGGQKDKTSDPDFDGMSNLEEFALDGNPASGANTGKVQSSIATVSGSPYLTLSIPVRNGATFTGSPLASAEVDGVAYTILGSYDLATFGETVVEVTPAIVILPTLTTGWSYKTFRLGATTTSQPKGFLRAKTSGPTP